MRVRSSIVIIVMSLVLLPATGLAFSFSEESAKDSRAQSAKAAVVGEALSAPCRSSLKGKRIALLLAERHGGQLSLGGTGVLFEAINHQLQSLGLHTITQGEINSKIAAAERMAILNNDPDAALAASGRVGADFFIRGVISGRAGKNLMVNANEVAVTIMMTLTDGRGRVLSSQRLSAESWAGQDVVGAALSVVEDEGAVAVARLYRDFCTQAGR
jgi:hypothetical protein